jgi:hypothetical protein|tara:strand:+ start:195 stop:416 length:222 start_codon:yes stop_codon:yes gene_type:complete
MGKKQTTPITVNDVEYKYEEMTPEQQAMVNHWEDLNRKIGSAQFNLNQLLVGRDAFVNMLSQSLTAVPEEDAA